MLHKKAFDHIKKVLVLFGSAPHLVPTIREPHSEQDHSGTVQRPQSARQHASKSGQDTKVSAPWSFFANKPLTNWSMNTIGLQTICFNGMTQILESILEFDAR